MNNVRHKIKKRKIYKLDEDDMMEIVTDHLAEESDFDPYQSVAMIKGTPEEDLRYVAVIGDYDDDEMKELDLDKLDQKIHYNGPNAHDKESQFVQNENQV